MDKHYNGKYEIATIEEIKTNSKYADVNVYRYVLTKNQSGLNIVTTRVGMGPRDVAYGPSHVQYRDQIIFDRKENKELPATGLQGHNFAQGVLFFGKEVGKQ
jgi:hypothetical protein